MRLDLLECIVDGAGGLHLLVHLSLHEVVPELVDVQVVAHLELSGILALIGGSFSNLLILLLTLDSTLDGLFLVSDASLEFKNALLSITLLLLNILHQIVEDVLGLKLLFLGLASLVLLTIENLRLVSKGGLKICSLNFASNEILLHALKHVEICATRHLLLVNLVVGLVEASGKLLESLLVVLDGAFDLLLGNREACNLFSDPIVLLLLERDKLLSLVVLLLDLLKLNRHFINLLLDVLVSGGDIRRLQKSVHLLELVGSVVDLEFLLHHCSTSA